MGFGWGLKARVKGAVSHAIDAFANNRLLHDFLRRVRPRGSLFEKAYASGAWGSTESPSGVGSELRQTDFLRGYLPDFFKKYEIRSVVDAACGDWNWMRLVDLSGIDYLGVDVVESVIVRNTQNYARPGVRFEVKDLITDPLPRADLIMCRDCWCLLSFQDLHAVLENFRSSGATWLLVSDSPGVPKNLNQITAVKWRHLNLSLPPFSFPAPVETFRDHDEHSPFDIKLWRISDLPKIKLPTARSTIEGAGRAVAFSVGG